LQRMKSSSTESGQRKRITRRGFLGAGCAVLGGGLAACLLGPAYATRMEPYWIEVTKLQIWLTNVRAAFDGFTIVHLSDFHVGRSVKKEQVRRAVEIANGLEPDLIVLTGDFVTGSAGHSVPCADELAALEAQQGVYAVLGNHDNWTDPDEVAENVAGAGIIVLRDEVAVTKVRGSRLWLLGVEDTGFTAGFYGGSFSDFRAIWREKELRLAAMLEGIPDDEPRLLLVHNPDFTEMLPTARIDLALCGHTHGGQVRVPLMGAPVVPSFFGDKYASGVVQGPSTLVYINRGIGLISPPIRFNCRPEVTLLRLRRSADVPGAQDDV